MKKAVLAVFLLFAASLIPLCAGTVTGTGWGETEEAALQNSRADLISRFSINISSVTYASAEDDGYGASSSSLGSYSLQSSSFNLLGVQEETERQNGGYFATSSLTEAQAPLYEAQLNNLYSTISSLYASLDSDGDFASQKNTYLRLISALRDYEIYQIVVLQLNPSSSAAARMLPVTRTVIEAEYQSRLLVENSNTSITVTNLQQQAQMGILSIQGEQELKEALAQLEENRKQQEELQALAEQDYSMRREEFQQSMAATISQLQAEFDAANVSAVTGDMSYSQLINNIEANRATLQAIKDSVNSQLRNIENAYDDAVSELRRKYEIMPYEANEMINGQPTVSARRYREQVLEAEIENLRGQYAPQANAVYQEAFARMSALTDYSLSYVDQLRKGRFTLNSFAPEVNTYIDSYAEAAKLFSGVAEITIGNEVITLYFRIPYENWTGESVPSQGDISAYSMYRDNAYDWFEIMREFPEIYTVEFEFTISNDYSSTYEVNFHRFSITRNDTGEEVFSTSIDQTDTLSYPSRTSLTDFSVTYDELLDMSQFKYARNSGSGQNADTASSAQNALSGKSGQDDAASAAEAVQDNRTDEKKKEKSSFSKKLEDGYLYRRFIIDAEVSALTTSDFDSFWTGAWVSIIPKVNFFSVGVQGTFLVDIPIGSNALASPSHIYIGPSLNLMYPVSHSLYIYAAVSAGGGMRYNMEGDFKFDSNLLYFGAAGSAGVIYGTSSGLGIKVSGNAAWLDNELYFGASAGFSMSF